MFSTIVGCCHGKSQWKIPMKDFIFVEVAAVEVVWSKLRVGTLLENRNFQKGTGWI